MKVYFAGHMAQLRREKQAFAAGAKRRLYSFFYHRPRPCQEFNHHIDRIKEERNGRKTNRDKNL